MLGLMFGGNSLEHEISIITAYQIKKKLKNLDLLTMIYVDYNNNIYNANKMSLNDFKDKKYKRLKKTCFITSGIKNIKIDLMIILGHGENSEDGLFASICKFYKIKFLGSDIFSSSLCMNKYYTYLFLHNKFKMVDTSLYTLNDYISGKELLVYPSILKPCCGGSSIGIEIINSKEELNEKANIIFKNNQLLIQQPYLNEIEEYNMALNETTYSYLELINKKDNIFSFENKYNDSFKQTHQVFITKRLDEFKELSRNIYSYLNLKGIVRIDYFIYNDEIYLNEINTIPGALSCYLFKDFINVIKDSIKFEYRRNYKIYKSQDYLKNNVITK